LWNEPNIGYWGGTQEEFHKLYDYSVDAVRRAIPRARIGGPETAGGPGGGTLEKFLAHCVNGSNAVTGKLGTPIDLISFHAKGQPKFVDGHVRMGISRQLQNINDAFAVIAKFPTLKNLPVVIGESDPEGCAACQGPQFGYRNGTMYSSYTAASFARKHDLAAHHGVNLEGALTWAFEFEGYPCFAGFRALASDGIDHPVLNVFRMFSKMSGRRLPVESSGAVSLEDLLKHGVRDRPDVSALASIDDRKLAVMLWHYHDDDVPGPDAAVTLRIPGLPMTEGAMRLAHYRVGPSTSNAYTVWKSIGQPSHPDEKQRAQLERAGQLGRMTNAPTTVPVIDGAISLPVSLPRQAVSLLVMEW
jgi:xylan 1,4-beta-xylosidase